MTTEQATDITGGLSYPSKMPGPAWNIPASRCLTGSKLRTVPGSTCEKCYALKGRYGFPSVQAALERRLKSFDHPDWVEAMTSLIGDTQWFRWFDSGDLQSEHMLLRIMDVCRRTPKTRHWLPTREYAIVRKVVEATPVPKNLTIRLSAHMREQRVPQSLLGPGVVASNVSKQFYSCPAPQQNNQCGECRKCWDRRVKNVTYKLH
jgi:hypothetical protein